MDEVTVKRYAELLRDAPPKSVMVVMGAGVSVSAGIPDFRTPGTGLYSRLERFKLAQPELIFNIQYFRKDPHPFYELAKEMFPGKFDPTPAHFFVRLLQDKGLLLRCYTQNVDTLERIAGIQPGKLVEAHGSFANSHCISCFKEYSTDWVREKIESNKVPVRCSCQGLVKPDIVFFGESLPDRFFRLMEKDFPKVKYLIVMGTSLKVQPFASLALHVPTKCPRLLINRELVGQGMLRFNQSNNFRDVALLGDCDEATRLICDL
eukprot:c8559_g1_i1.p1 GENE.c8559_g1_i1~~c8559_g1_i1.p1  ORF type:complete len:275 (+),score=65.36 c8559_g1_i1:39-827(+)